jgi:hypothetical protein
MMRFTIGCGSILKPEYKNDCCQIKAFSMFRALVADLRHRPSGLHPPPEALECRANKIEYISG